MAINDLAEYLGVTHQRVHQMSNQLPAPRQIAGRRMWSRPEVERWGQGALVGDQALASALVLMACLPSAG
jgi:hypothetical protein